MKNEILSILKETHILLNAIIFILFAGIGLWCNSSGFYIASTIFGAYAFITGFNLHDCIDYGRRFSKFDNIVVYRDGKIIYAYKRFITAYRIEQWIIMVFLGGFVWSGFGFWALFWGFVMWQFLVADIMFYLVLKEPLIEMNYEWLEGWSFVAAILKPIGRSKFVGISIVGALLPFIWIVLSL